MINVAAQLSFRHLRWILRVLFTFVAASSSNASAGSSALDFVNFINGPPEIVGSSVSADANGEVYEAGCTESSSSIQTSLGALQAQGTGPMAFLREISADGSKVLFSALLGVTGDCFVSTQVAAKTDSSGNTYVAFNLWGSVAGVSSWNGDPNGHVAVLKISPQGNNVLYGIRVFPYFTGAVSLDIDSNGAAYVALAANGVMLAKIDPSGSSLEYSYSVPPPSTANASLSGQGLGISVGTDQSLYVAVNPCYVYRLDPTGTRLMYQTTIDPNGIQSVSAIAVDGAGNAYVTGSALFKNGTSPMPLTQIDFTQAVPGSTHGFVVKLDPSGAVSYSAGFDTSQLTTIAVDGQGRAWAAGGSMFGFTVLALDPSGTTLLHYLSLPAIITAVTFSGENQANGIAIDSAGRVLLTGGTPSFTLPNSGAGHDPVGDSDDNHDVNAFVLRIAAAPPQTDVQVLTTTSTSTACELCYVTYEVQVENTGTATATDVLLKFPDFVNGAPYFPTMLASCRTSGTGSCSINGQFARIVFASLAPGEAEYVELVIATVIPTPNPLSFLLAALSSTDDPNQGNNHSVIDTPTQTVLFLIGGATGFVVQVNGQTYPSNGYPNYEVLGIPVGANTGVEVYVPSPQVLNGVLIAFAGWSDGSTANPRVFQIGTVSPGITMLLRQVTEPWVSPDAPVVHAGSYHSGAIAPGEVVALFGYNLGPPQLQTAALDSSGRVAQNLSGLQVFFDGTPAPIVYTSANASSVIVPYSVAGKSTVNLSIQYDQLTSSALALNVAESAPGLFTLNAAGAGPLAAFNSDGSLNSVTNPVAHGGTVVFFGSGEGLTNPTPADGTINSSPAPTPQLPVSVTIGGQSATVLYAGGASGVTAGLLQINAQVPAAAGSGLLPVILTVGANSSQWGATIAVQ